MLSLPPLLELVALLGRLLDSFVTVDSSSSLSSMAVVLRDLSLAASLVAR